MNQLQEKRISKRHRCDAPVTLLYPQRQSRQIDARLMDYSENGVAFFCHRPLTPGTTIIVRASQHDYPCDCVDANCQLRTMGVATIKWCHESQRHGHPYHEMGAVYLIPY